MAAALPSAITTGILIMADSGPTPIGAGTATIIIPAPVCTFTPAATIAIAGTTRSAAIGRDGRRRGTGGRCARCGGTLACRAARGVTENLLSSPTAKERIKEGSVFRPRRYQAGRD